MNKLTKAALTGVAALGLIGGGLVTGGGAPAAEAATVHHSSYSSKNACLTAKMDIRASYDFSGVNTTVTVNCVKVPLSSKYHLGMIVG